MMTGAGAAEGQQLARLVDQATVPGNDLVGPRGLLTGLTTRVLETSTSTRRFSTAEPTRTIRP